MKSTLFELKINDNLSDPQRIVVMMLLQENPEPSKEGMTQSVESKTNKIVSPLNKFLEGIASEEEVKELFVNVSGFITADAELYRMTFDALRSKWNDLKGKMPTIYFADLTWS